MRNADEHVLIPTLKRQLVDHLIDRREFVRYAALLGMSATAAYAFVHQVTGEPLVGPAAAFDIDVGDVVTTDDYDLDRTLQRQPLDPEVAIADNPASTRPIEVPDQQKGHDPAE